MSIVKVIQHLSISDNEIQNVRLQNTPNLTGTGLTGKFGINNLGAIVYIAGYEGSNPVINRLKQLIVASSENGEAPLLRITNDVAGFKDSIAIDIEALLSRLFKDDQIIDNSSWTSTRIVEYINERLNQVFHIPISDETLTPILTSAEMNVKYPETSYGVGTTVYSATSGIQYTKISNTLWKFEEIEIR